MPDPKGNLPKRFTFDVFLGLISWVFAPLNWHWGSLLKPLLLLCWLFYFEERNLGGEN